MQHVVHRSLRLALSLALLWVTIGCGSTPEQTVVAPATAEIPREALNSPSTVPLLKQREYLLAPVRIKGESVGWFLVDTGAGISAIDRGRARALGLEEIGGGSVRGIGGEREVQYVQTPRFDVAGVTHSPSRVASLGLTSIGRALGLPLGGVLGYSTMAQGPFTIDPFAKTLTLHPPGMFSPPPNAKAFGYRMVGGVPAVQAGLGPGQNVWIILDTGSDGQVALPFAAARRFPNLRAPGLPSGPGRSRGVGGDVTTTQTWLRTFEFLGRTMAHTRVSFEPDTTGAARSGLLVGRVGMGLLRDAVLTFDPPRQTVYVQWR